MSTNFWLDFVAAKTISLGMDKKKYVYIKNSYVITFGYQLLLLFTDYVVYMYVYMFAASTA
jgi:hypothetical protein